MRGVWTPSLPKGTERRWCAAFTSGSAGGALAPAIVGWVATSHSIATALPLLALSFFLIVPMFLFVARETTRQELTDFVGQMDLLQ